MDLPPGLTKRVASPIPGRERVFADVSGYSDYESTCVQDYVLMGGFPGGIVGLKSGWPCVGISPRPYKRT